MEWLFASASFAGVAFLFKRAARENSALGAALAECPSVLDLSLNGARNGADGDRQFAFLEASLRSSHPETVMGVPVAASAVSSYSIETATTTVRDKNGNAHQSVANDRRLLSSTDVLFHGELRLEADGLRKPIMIDRSLRSRIVDAFQTLSETTTANAAPVVNVNLAAVPEGRVVTGTHTLQILRGVREGEPLTVVGDFSASGKVFAGRRMTIVSPLSMSELRAQSSQSAESLATAGTVCMLFGLVFGGVGVYKTVAKSRGNAD